MRERRWLGGGRQRAMETAQHLDRLAKNQPAEIAMFQISEVQEAPAFNGGRSFLTLRVVVLFSAYNNRMFSSHGSNHVRTWQ